jgi:hypothetical protein
MGRLQVAVVNHLPALAGLGDEAWAKVAGLGHRARGIHSRPKPGSGWDCSAQLPAVARGVLTEHKAETVTVECRMFESGLLQPRLQGREVAFDLDRHMCPGRRAVVGILTQVDLLAVLALEPPDLECELRWRDHAPVAEDLQEEYLLGLRPSNGHPEVHVMKAQHAGSLLILRSWRL